MGKVWELLPPKKLTEIAEASGEPDKVEKAKVTVVAHAKEVNDVLVAPNNKLMASAGQDRLVRIWSYPEAKLLGELKGHRKGVWCVAFSPVDQVLASASGDSSVRIWNLRDFTPIRVFQGHMGAALRVHFLRNGMQLMSSGSDGLIKLWQIRTADCAESFDEHEGKVWCFDMLNDTMVSGGTDSKLCVWRDSTAEKEKIRHDERAELAMKDSRIAVLARQGKVEEALSLALDLDRSGQMRQILSDYTLDRVNGQIVTKISKKGGKSDEDEAGDENDAGEDETKPKVDLRRWVAALSVARLEKFVGLLEQWNSNRRMSSMAQMFLGLILEVVSPGKLTVIEGMNATCASLLSYSTRHLSRVEALLQKTFVFDLVLQSGGAGLALIDEDDSARKLSEEGGGAEGALAKTMEVLHGKRTLGGGDEDDSDDDEIVQQSSDDEIVMSAAPAKEADDDDDEVDTSAVAEKRAAAEEKSEAAPGAARKKRKKGRA